MTQGSDALRVVCGLLATILLASIIFSPWLSLGTSATLPSWVQQGTSILLPLLERFAPEPLPTALNQLQEFSRLSPLEILRMDFVSWRMKVVILMPIVAALIGLLATALWLMRQNELAQLAYWMTAGVAVIAAVLMVIGMPLLLHVGLPREIATNLVIALFNVRLAFGFWITWAALLGLTVVGALLATSSPTPKSRPTYAYPTRRY